jgi:hypothetical protein
MEGARGLFYLLFAGGRFSVEPYAQPNFRFYAVGPAPSIDIIANKAAKYKQVGSVRSH